MLKGDLRKQGFDPGAVSDPLFVLKPGEQRYVPLDPGFFDRIMAGEAGY